MGTSGATCNPPGGQYCGAIGDVCSRVFRCPAECSVPGFICGGRGVPNLCGAAFDSGLCKPLACSTAGANYCGRIGDGCGGTIDCGECEGFAVCGARGIPGVCGLSDDRGSPLTCTRATTIRYCGVLGAIPNMCGWDPMGPFAPPPGPISPQPPAPPRPQPPPPETRGEGRPILEPSVR
jgi:hypothetical protein